MISELSLCYKCAVCLISVERNIFRCRHDVLTFTVSADLSVSVDEFHEREEVVCEIKQMDSSGSVCSWAAKCAATDDRPAESDRSVFVITKPAVGDSCGAQRD